MITVSIGTVGVRYPLIRHRYSISLYGRITVSISYRVNTVSNVSENENKKYESEGHSGMEYGNSEGYGKDGVR